MTVRVILILVGGACVAVAAWGLWSTPSTRDYLTRIFTTRGGR